MMTQERVDAHPKKVCLVDRVVVHFDCGSCKDTSPHGVHSAVISYPKGDNNKAIRYALLSLLSLLSPLQKARQALVCGAEVAQPECERSASIRALA